ncbi:HD domain-containing metal-dependentphosphohydrolase family protein [Striga asiatica]|uniref:HD domain-containing metal-dependentphosphohydrolase family protein n=1 Tax=Striga asiatica TaxID=4170 RepID=A0A5A7R3K1_STRAF|nr:HD domain-containing metal-dependentphosphohydrolase family protein [Striga asiatica]
MTSPESEINAALHDLDRTPFEHFLLVPKCTYNPDIAVSIWNQDFVPMAIMLVYALISANSYLQLASHIQDPSQYWKLDDTIIKTTETAPGKNSRKLGTLSFAYANEIYARMHI